jgi:hypothetical protein
MNYLQIRLILSIYKAFYDCRQTTARDTHARDILKHSRWLQRLKETLFELSPNLTEEELTTINQDYNNILVSIYYHFR